MQGIWKKINWESVGWAMQEVPVNRHCWVSKYVSGHFVTGKNMCQWKFQTSVQCPQCQEPQEDKNHILTCPATEAQDLWNKSLKALEQWLKDKGTDIQILEYLMQYLQSWPSPPKCTSSTPIFVAKQDDISIKYIWDGWLCCGWQEHQDQIWKQFKSCKSSQ